MSRTNWLRYWRGRYPTLLRWLPPPGCRNKTRRIYSIINRRVHWLSAREHNLSHPGNILQIRRSRKKKCRQREDQLYVVVSRTLLFYMRTVSVAQCPMSSSTVQWVSSSLQLEGNKHSNIWAILGSFSFFSKGHISFVCNVLKLLHNARVALKLKKCWFSTETADYPRHLDHSR